MSSSLHPVTFLGHWWKGLFWEQWTAGEQIPEMLQLSPTCDGQPLRSPRRKKGRQQTLVPTLTQQFGLAQKQCWRLCLQPSLPVLG